MLLKIGSNFSLLSHSVMGIHFLQTQKPGLDKDDWNLNLTLRLSSQDRSLRLSFSFMLNLLSSISARNGSIIHIFQGLGSSSLE